MKVMDNKLFTVEPMKGVLEPGECHTVTLTYRHIMPGTDRLPVLLKLARGREILVRPLAYKIHCGHISLVSQYAHHWAMLQRCCVFRVRDILYDRLSNISLEEIFTSKKFTLINEP